MGQQLGRPVARPTAKRNWRGWGDWICSEHRAPTLLPPGQSLADAPPEHPSGRGRGRDRWAYGAGALVNHMAEQLKLGKHSGGRGGLPSCTGALEDRGQLSGCPSSIVGLREVCGRAPARRWQPTEPSAAGRSGTARAGPRGTQGCCRPAGN
jgi:hypothetical protein